VRQFRIQRLVSLCERIPCRVADIPTRNKYGDLQILFKAGLVEVQTARRESDDKVFPTQSILPERIVELFGNGHKTIEELVENIPISREWFQRVSKS